MPLHGQLWRPQLIQAIVVNSNGRAQRTEEPSDAEPREERLPEQHPRADPLLSLQDHRLAGGLQQEGLALLHREPQGAETRRERAGPVRPRPHPGAPAVLRDGALAQDLHLRVQHEDRSQARQGRCRPRGQAQQRRARPLPRLRQLHSQGQETRRTQEGGEDGETLADARTDEGGRERGRGRRGNREERVQEVRRKRGVRPVPGLRYHRRLPQTRGVRLLRGNRVINPASACIIETPLLSGLQFPLPLSRLLPQMLLPIASQAPCAEAVIIIIMNQEGAGKGGERSPSPCSSGEQSAIRGGEGESAAARRRLKRKRNKERHRAKLKQVREKGMIVFQNIIKDIYALRANYQTVEHVLEEFFLLEANSEVLYDTIDSIMRQEIDLIRRKIVAELNAFPLHAEEAARDKSAKNVFECIRRIQRGSPEIEKIINLFVRRRFGGEEDDPPLKTNLDLMTLKFLYRNDLQPSEHFAAIVQRIAKEDAFKREREIYNAMVLAAVRPEERRDSDWSGYESEEEEGGSAGREAEEEEQEEQGGRQEEEQGNRRKKRRGRKRRGRVDLQMSFESILQRTEQLQIREQQRLECKVEEDWIKRMQEQRAQYRRPPDAASL